MRVPSNGLRYPLVGGTRQRHFDGTSFKPQKLPENAQTPTSRVHAVLGTVAFLMTSFIEVNILRRAFSNAVCNSRILAF